MSEAFKLFIPDIGDCVQLTEDWEFPLHLEYRNHVLINRLKPGTRYGYGASHNTLLVTFKAGTVLQVDRIYIRKGKTEWSSITFFVKYDPGDVDRGKQTSVSGYWSSYSDRTVSTPEAAPEQKRKGARFWAKLDSVNEMVVRRIAKEDIPADQKPVKQPKATKPKATKKKTTVRKKAASADEPSDHAPHELTSDQLYNLCVAGGADPAAAAAWPDDKRQRFIDGEVVT